MGQVIICDLCKKILDKIDDQYYTCFYKEKGTWKIRKGIKPEMICYDCGKKIGLNCK